MTHFNLGSGEQGEIIDLEEGKKRKKKKKLQCRKAAAIKWKFQPMILWSGGQIRMKDHMNESGDNAKSGESQI